MQKNDENTLDPRLARVLAWIVGIGALLFMLWFFATQWAGIQALLAWLWAGIADFPNAVNRVVTHYSTLAPNQILPSVVIGAVFGAISTVYVVKKISLRGFISGVSLGAIGSQLLVLPTQHCTYAPDTDATQVIIGFGITLLGAGAILVPLWTYLNGTVGVGFVAGYFRSRWLPYALILPMVINLVIFLYYPSVQTVTLSLFSKRFPLPQERFVCLNNYSTLVNDVIYQNSFFTSLFFTVTVVFTSMALSLGIAVLASQKIKFASVYRTVLIFPFALSPVVAGAIFLTMFREGQTGLINSVIYTFTGTTLNWLRDPNLARITVVLASVWNILGFNVLFYVAGLQTMPKDILEAAEIDGASRVQRFFRITFPLLAPYSFFLLITNVTYSFYGIYGAVDTLTAGGPPLGAAGALGGATDVLIFKLYEDAFNPGSPVGLAGAQAVILFIIVASLTVLQFRTLESRITYGE
jgi:sn-glycerol 3-phosphate transport system permease protein